MSLIRLFGNNMLRDPFFERTLESLWPDETAGRAGGRGAGEMTTWMPRADVSESAKDIKICASLPGVKKEDINIDLDEDGRFLTITGKTESKVDKDETSEGRQYHYVERSYGNFRRSFQLPINVDTKSIKANYENGVLEVCVPKMEQTPRTKRIEIGGQQSIGQGAQGDMGKTGQMGQQQQQQAGKAQQAAGGQQQRAQRMEQ